MTIQTILDGLNILRKYGDGDFSAEHDRIWAGDEPGDKIIPEDKEELEKIGWFIDDEFDCWSCFC